MGHPPFQTRDVPQDAEISGCPGVYSAVTLVADTLAVEPHPTEPSRQAKRVKERSRLADGHVHELRQQANNDTCRGVGGSLTCSEREDGGTISLDGFAFERAMANALVARQH